MNQQFYEDTEAFFLGLPEEKTREYEKKIAKYAQRCTGGEQIQALQRMADSDAKCAYEAFFCLTVIYRRNKDFEMLREALSHYGHFKRRISYNHIWLQYLVHSETFYDYDELLISAYRDAQLLNENSGYLQTFCNAFATICEQCNVEDRQRIVNEWYDTALTCVEQAIELDPAYAKFYCTKARIVSLKEHFQEANRLINLAIAKEDSSRPDYALTIMNYQSYKLTFALLQQRMEFDGKLKALEARISELSTGNTVAAQADAVPQSDTAAGTAEEEESFELSVYSGEKPYIFISYAHGDQEAVYGIIGALEKAGIRVWFDRGIRLGAEWPEEVGNHLVQSATVVVMLSSNSIQSANVRREVNLALSEKLNLIVVLLDAIVLSPGMKLQFGLYQMIDKADYQPKQFVAALGNALGREVGYSDDQNAGY